MKEEKKIVEYPFKIIGDKVLEQKAESCSEEELEGISNLLIETMKKFPGLGLSAPQVNISKRVIVLSGKDGYTIMRNPVITKKSGELVNDREACFSIPGVDLVMERPKYVSVKYFNFKHDLVETDLSESMSRVLQHEVDHLNGILMTDGISDLQKKLIRKKLKRIKEYRESRQTESEENYGK